jgi:cytochrome b561
MHWSSTLVHLALWVLLLVLPITAVLELASKSSPLTLLGGLRIDPTAIIANPSIAKLADWGDVHTFLGDAVMWIAGLHAAAAIYHYLFLKDGVLATMLPYKWFR